MRAYTEVDDDQRASESAVFADGCDRSSRRSQKQAESCRRIGRWYYTHPLATLKPGSRGLHALMTCQVAHFTDQEAIAICGGLV